MKIEFLDSERVLHHIAKAHKPKKKFECIHVDLEIDYIFLIWGFY